ncbi:DNA replication regulator SLD3-domain-containing protein [Hypoxylon sp. FL1150]|nr:DNA replication regulator SLD3-domain-containing protein [Hypoxylon sp. FL1150]
MSRNQDSQGRHGEAMGELLKPSIVVKVHPTNLSTKPRSLQPLMLLPREHLQLSLLDLASPYGSFESSRYYESSIKILDLEGRMGSRPVVLIARLETDKTLYVLERQKNALYTLCHLGSWANLQELQGFATVSCPHLIQRRSNSSTELSTPHPLTTPQLHHDNKKRRLAIEAIQSLVKKPARSRSLSTLSQPVSPAEVSTPGRENVESQASNGPTSQDATPKGAFETQNRCQMSKVPEPDVMLATPTADTIFDNIRTQYYESLYHSMGSLAYFAKGPMSRARAAFHLDCDSNLEMNDLMEFLKSLVITTTHIDKKYRQTVPDIISKMKSTFQDSEAEQESTKTRKRKAKKMKLGKDGLYPAEDEHVRKWWNARKPEFKDDETMTTVDPQDTKHKISLLRLRETQLQMIIILEILALEPLVTPKDGEESQLPGLSGLDEEAPKPTKDTKKRNRNNLSSLIDFHTNWLNIWQSTTLDEVKLPDDTQGGKEPETQKSSKITSDPLKDFCVDIIVPFFSARLPEKCDSINRQLGGPTMMPPQKPRVRKPEKPDTATKSKTKPGSITKRPASKSSRTLERVLSKETERNRRSMSRGPSGVIALMRSASTPMLKRENSEPSSMLSIPKADSSTSRERPSRPPLAGPVKRMSEGDKAKKEALLKTELQDAISALRRPNREVVGKAMAEADERRVITSLSSLKKSRKPTQHSHLQNIVKATPAARRFTDVLGIGTGSQSIHFRGSGSADRSSIPSSSLIPSSGPRKRNHEAAFPLEESPAISRSNIYSRTYLDRIEATPAKSSKHSFLSVPGADEEAILGSSPTMSRKLSLKSFRDSGVEMPTSPGGEPDDELTATPLKSRPVPIPLGELVTATPTKRRILDKGPNITNTEKAPAEDGKENTVKKQSIFERLGWDDDFDDLA